METYPCLVGGEWRQTGSIMPVISPWTGKPVHQVCLAGDPEAEDALVLASRAFETTRLMPAFRRSDLLKHFSIGIGERAGEIAAMITAETGKPIKLATIEVQRSRETVETAAEEARRIGGEVVPLDWSPGGEGYVGIYRRFPVGPVLGITAFNFPVNLACHKIAPAVAAGAPVILRPSSKAPRAALILGEILLEAGMVPEALSVLPSSTSIAEKLASDDRVAVLSFTGSPEVGWHLKTRAGRKKACLELGGNGASIVHSDADLDRAADRIVTGGFSFSGQVCISVQRVFVHRPVAEALVSKLVDRSSHLSCGDPSAHETDIGPLVSDEATQRVLSSITKALGGGAVAVTGGGCLGRCVSPTILMGTTPDMEVNRTEIFGPVITLTPYDSFEEAIQWTNASEFGLQAGVFTQDIGRILSAYRDIRCGGVVINDIPSFRMDHMPYGGIKGSGMGKEGPKYAIEEMTEGRILVIRRT
jgi:acyl-CoA reductase-like NAD-dependent aldehyde dehydrogenase